MNEKGKLEMQDAMFHVTIQEFTGVVTIQAYGFVAELRPIQTLKGTEYTVSFPNSVLALDFKSFQQYMYFIEYIEYHLEALNA